MLEVLNSLAVILSSATVSFLTHRAWVPEPEVLNSSCHCQCQWDVEQRTPLWCSTWVLIPVATVLAAVCCCLGFVAGSCLPRAAVRHRIETQSTFRASPPTGQLFLPSLQQ